MIVDGRSLLAQVIREASRLGLTPWERLALILVVALLLVLGRRGIEAVRGLALEPALPPEEPQGIPLAQGPDGGFVLPTDPNASPDDAQHMGG